MRTTKAQEDLAQRRVQEPCDDRRLHRQYAQWREDSHRALAARGLATLRFDFTGIGASDGDFADTTFSANVDDIIAAADWLRAHVGAPALLIGHSLGGAAAIAAADRIADVRAVATIGAPSDVAHILHRFDDALSAIARDGKAAVKLGGRLLEVGQAFVDDARAQAILAQVGRLKKPLLILHAPLDDEVGIENATALFTAAKHPKSFISLDGANHFLTGQGDATAAAAAIAGWAERYMPSAPADDIVAAPQSAIRAREAARGKLEDTVSAGPHRFQADEPVAAGDVDAGPTLFEARSET